jgi:hypothetical protein
MSPVLPEDLIFKAFILNNIFPSSLQTSVQVLIESGHLYPLNVSSIDTKLPARPNTLTGLIKSMLLCCRGNQSSITDVSAS